MIVEKELHHPQPPVSEAPEMNPDQNTPEPNSAQLIQLAEREVGGALARDLNKKLDELEGQLGLLNRHFDDSRQVLASNLDTLRTFNQQLTAEIESTRRQLAAEMTTSRQQMTEEFDASHQRLASELASSRQQFSDDLKASRQQLESDIELARRQMTAQSANHYAATEALEARVQAAQAALKAQLGQTTEVLGGELQRLHGLHEQLDASHTKTEADLLALGLGTRKQFRWVAGGLGVTAALLLTGFVTLQFFPSAVPLSVSQHLNSLQGSVDGQAAELGGLQASLDQAREQLASLQQGLQFNSETDSIRNGQTTRQLVGLTDALGLLQKQMDDLQYRVMGPGNPQRAPPSLWCLCRIVPGWPRVRRIISAFSWLA